MKPPTRGHAGPENPTNITPSRRSPAAALERAMQAVGEAWATDWANTLRGEGRAVAGGWPGTISEARQRVAACAAGRLRPGSSIDPGELEALTRRVYEIARKAWLERAVLEDG